MASQDISQVSFAKDSSILASPTPVRRRPATAGQRRKTRRGPQPTVQTNTSILLAEPGLSSFPRLPDDDYSSPSDSESSASPSSPESRSDSPTPLDEAQMQDQRWGIEHEISNPELSIVPTRDQMTHLPGMVRSPRGFTRGRRASTILSPVVATATFHGRMRTHDGNEFAEDGKI